MKLLIPAGSGVVKPEIRKLLKVCLQFSCTLQVQFHHPEWGSGGAGGRDHLSVHSTQSLSPHGGQGIEAAKSSVGKWARSPLMLLTVLPTPWLQISLLFRTWRRYRRKTSSCRWQPLPGMLYSPEVGGRLGNVPGAISSDAAPSGRSTRL